MDMALIGIIGGLDLFGCDLTLKFLAENCRVKVAVFYPAYFNSVQIQTGIHGNKNLEICRVDMENPLQLQQFIGGCTLLIYCGIPIKLCDNPDGIPIYAPIIKKTGVIAKIVRGISSIRKVIFIAAPARYDLDDHFNKPTNIPALEKKGEGSQIKNHNTKKALFHADRVIQNLIESFLDTRLEIIFVSPVGVKNNALLNNSGITAAGLKFLFASKINHDPITVYIIIQVFSTSIYC